MSSYHPKLIVPERGERAAFLGKSGSGKSVLGKRLLQCSPYQCNVIIDPKHEIFASNAKYIHTPAEFKPVEDELLIYQPTVKTDNIDDYNELFKRIYYRRKLLVFIDELYAVCSNNIGPEYLKALYTRGRSMDISVWGCSQRPTHIPLYCITEVNKIYEFTLRNIEDRKRVAGMIGDSAMQLLPPHNFLYSDDTNPVIKMKYDIDNDIIEGLK